MTQQVRLLPRSLRTCLIPGAHVVEGKNISGVLSLVSTPKRQCTHRRTLYNKQIIIFEIKKETKWWKADWSIWVRIWIWEKFHFHHFSERIQWVCKMGDTKCKGLKKFNLRARGMTPWTKELAWKAWWRHFHPWNPWQENQVWKATFWVLHVSIHTTCITITISNDIWNIQKVQSKSSVVIHMCPLGWTTHKVGRFRDLFTWAGNVNVP